MALLLVSVALLMGTTCNKTRTCEGAICTMLFASVTVQVVDSLNVPVQLDDVYTVRNSTGEQIRLSQPMTGGRYNILDDGFQKKIENTSESFELIGTKGGQQIIKEPYYISADCCHIKKDSGKDSIIVR